MNSKGCNITFLGFRFSTNFKTNWFSQHNTLLSGYQLSKIWLLLVNSLRNKQGKNQPNFKLKFFKVWKFYHNVIVLCNPLSNFLLSYLGHKMDDINGV